MYNQIMFESKNSFFDNQNHTKTISNAYQPPDFKVFLQTRGFNVREAFFAATSKNNFPVIALDLDWRIMYCNHLASEDLAKKETIPIGTLLDKFAPLIQKPNSEGNNFKSSWEELVRKGLFIGLRFRSYLLLETGIIYQIVLTGSPLFDTSGDLVGGACLYQKYSDF